MRQSEQKYYVYSFRLVNNNILPVMNKYYTVLSHRDDKGKLSGFNVDLVREGKC